jgi:hypothetical protein
MSRRGDHESLKKEPVMRIAITCGFVFGAVMLLQPTAAGPFGEKKVLTLEIARKIVTAAESEATRNHLAEVGRWWMTADGRF